MNTKQKILNTAEYLFYTQGYNNTGINQIISEAGVARACLYHHFGSKVDLCKQVLDKQNENLLKNLGVVLKSAKNSIQFVEKLFEFVMRFVESPDFQGCWCLNIIGDIPSNEQVLKKHILDSKNDFISFLSSHLVAIDKNISNDQVLQLYLCYESAISESLVLQSTWPVVQGKKMATRIIGND